MFVAAIAAGATSLGVDVHVAGVVPTPALAFLAGTGPFAAGIMVSASHNPADDNGLKVLDADGPQARRRDRGRARAADLARRRSSAASATPSSAGRSDAGAAVERYRRPPARRWPARSTRRGLRIVLDCANGSGGVVGPEILAATGRPVEVIHDEPDGVNINVESGATAPGVARRGGRASAAPTSGSRSTATPTACIAVDATGTVVDGDQVLGILALDRLDARRPARGRARRVGPVERRAAGGGRGGRRPGRPDAGRRQVHPRGDAGVAGPALGGEKSGHVIVLEHTTSGDGIVTALEVLRVMTRGRRGRSPTSPPRSRCCPSSSAPCRPATRTSGRAIRPPARDRATPRRASAATGRVLVRPSGTEPALRVMVEGPDAALVAELADALAALAGERLN